MGWLEQYLLFLEAKSQLLQYWLMSKCLCISCGYESFILCCADRPEYYSLCLPCLNSISYIGISCQGCSKSVANVVYRLQKQIAVQQNNRNPLFMNSSFSKENNQKECYRVNSDPISAFKKMNLSTPIKREYGNQFNETQTTKLGDWRNVSNEELRKATQCLEKPLDYQMRLQRERKKNNIPCNKRSSSKWEDSCSQLSDQSIW